MIKRVIMNKDLKQLGLEIKISQVTLSLLDGRKKYKTRVNKLIKKYSWQPSHMNTTQIVIIDQPYHQEVHRTQKKLIK